LFFQSLGGDQPAFVTGVSNFKQPKSDRGRWLAYLLKGPEKILVLRDLINNKQQTFDLVTDYSFDNSGKVLLLKRTTKEGTVSTNELSWISLEGAGDSKVVWSDNTGSVSGYTFDANGSQLAFIIKSASGNSLWYYKASMDKAVQMADDQAQGVDKGLFITDGPPSFSTNGRHIIFRLQPQPDTRKAKTGGAQVNIWSYRDSVLQSAQLKERSDAIYKAAITVGSNKVIRLEQDNESADLLPGYGDYVELHTASSISNYWWPSYPNGTVWIVSLEDGNRRQLPLPSSSIDCQSFSPGGHYFVYGDMRNQQYYSYKLSTGRLLKISAQVPVPLQAQDRYEVDKGRLSGANMLLAGTAAWLDDGSAILVYDKNYDIWQLDPACKKQPENITNSYAKSRHIIFRIMLDEKEQVKGIPAKSRLLLLAFNNINKYNGFYRKQLGVKGNPGKLTMGPYNYRHASFQQMRNEAPMNSGLEPLKAHNTDTWLVYRQSATEAPNYYTTKDFKNFTAQTNLAPHKEYNWYTTELVHWKQLDGTPDQGILYKPENFDPQKKYPIIFHYYEKLTFTVYDWLMPEFKTGMNIPWFVSHGYLVFCPDIYYKAGHTGQSAINSVVSAARYVSQLHFVDRKRMGLEGVSFGGFETNYLITHTHMFAAASEGCGPSDFVGGFGELRGTPGKEDYAAMPMYESSQNRIGATLWQRPDLYIENSPIFKANEVTTPLLMMHNKGDAAVSWRHGIEFYMGLRRLQKKVWMLEYDKGTHGVGGQDAVDYNLRMTQFFEHYLKGAPAPVWMTRGIPAKLKGIDDGLALDPNGKP